MKDDKHAVGRIHLNPLDVKDFAACRAYSLKADHRGTFVFPNCTELAQLPNAHGSKARELVQRLDE